MRTATLERVEDTVMEAYLANTVPLSVIEIRQRCRLSKTIIRRAVKESTRVKLTTKQISVLSRTTPGRVHQSRVIDAFYPTREWLVEVLNKAQREYHYFRTERKWR